MNSYSQNGEDKTILPLFNGEIGRFLDLGAWDPRTLSNSRALYEAGWSGIVVEASPQPCLSQLNEYGQHTLTDERIVIIHAAVGFDRHCVPFYVTDDAVSTTEKAQYERWKGAATYRGKFYTPTITLEDIFNQFGGPFDFVNIDVEGCSVDLFAALLKTAAYPKVICIEHDGRTIEAMQMATNAGYQCVLANGENLVFAR